MSKTRPEIDTSAKYVDGFDMYRFAGFSIHVGADMYRNYAFAYARCFQTVLK